jgi:hypothetical protein
MKKLINLLAITFLMLFTSCSGWQLATSSYYDDGYYYQYRYPTYIRYDYRNPYYNTYWMWTDVIYTPYNYNYNNYYKKHNPKPQPKPVVKEKKPVRTIKPDKNYPKRRNDYIPNYNNGRRDNNSPTKYRTYTAPRRATNGQSRSNYSPTKRNNSIPSRTIKPTNTQRRSTSPPVKRRNN